MPMTVRSASTVLALAAMAVACRSSDSENQNPPRAIDARAGTADVEETDGEYAAKWQAETAAEIADLEALLGRATAVRLTMTMRVEAGDGRSVIVERCGWRMLARNEIEDLRSAIRAFPIPDPAMAPACMFIPTFRFDVIAPDRTIRADVCLGCDQIKAGKLDMFFGDRETPALEAWAIRILGEGDTEYARAIGGALEMREPLPCPP